MRKWKGLWAMWLTAACVLWGCGSGGSSAVLEGQNITGVQPGSAGGQNGTGQQPGSAGSQSGTEQQSSSAGSQNGTGQSGSAGSQSSMGMPSDAAGGTSGVQGAIPYQQPEMRGEITVSCLYSEEFVSAAAEQFMKKYPDVKVTINPYMDTIGSGTSDLPVEEYQTYLNTRIMTGKAEDILFVNFLPITKYSEMGVFEDLSGYVQAMPEMNDDNYFMNVLRAAQQDSGELYVLPYRVRFDTISLSTALRAEQGGKWGSLKDTKGVHFSTVMDIAKQLVDGTNKQNAFLIQMNAIPYADCLIKDSLSRFIDVDNREVHLDTPEYIQLIKSVKALNDEGYFDSDVDFYNVEYYFAALCDFDIQAAYYSLDPNGDTTDCVPLADAEGNVSILSSTCAALNSASGNKALAWEFLRYLLSDEVQTLPSLYGLSANRKGLDAVAQRYYSLWDKGNGGAGFGSAEAYKNLLVSWMEQINDCDTLDTAVMTLIDAENEKYFAGQQTAEDTARRLQRQLEQYFNE